ncbi:MAG TPA: tripartite tricarboxylate transporter substrate binding protein [Reyranella sp.]|nr:tripartite tricarboxylate transporter substrate binding protein [Reyranella sp.]
MKRFLPALIALAIGVAPALAQDYPSRPVRIIVPTAPGGMADILARVYAQKFSEKTNQPVLVENRTGAGGVIAAEHVAKSPADGYTLYLGLHATNSILPNLDPKLPYDAAKDFAPVIHIANLPNVLVVNSKVEARSVKELVELARAKPGGLSYASQGTGSSGHVAGEQFRLLTKTNIVHVPYKGAAPALQDLRGGHVSMMFDVVPFALQHIQEGSVRGLAVTAPQRLSVLPDIPTMAEVGYPEIQGGAWFALFAPANTPTAIIDLLNKEGRETFALPDVRQQLEPRGVVLVLGTPQQLGDFVAADTERWKKVIREAGIKLE